jgi:prevent-host-death family protein
MKVNATEFKAKCLSLIDHVHDSGEPVVITKRGRVVARLVPEGQVEERPWLKLRGTVRWLGDPVKPAVDEDEIEALR